MTSPRHPGSEPADGVWYQEGLRFECTQCGNCCSGPSGWVEFTPGELQRMAAHLEVLPYQFLQRFAHRQKGRWSLNEVQNGEHLDCVFLRRDPETGKALCSIYAVRPMQCRTWPFWRSNLRSRAAWAEAAQQCPGMAAGQEGRGEVHSLDHILHQRHRSPLDA